MKKDFKFFPEVARQVPICALDEPVFKSGHPKVDDGDDEEDDEDVNKSIRGLSIIDPFTSISSNLYKTDYNNRIIVINEQIDERCFVYAKMIEDWNRKDSKVLKCRELAKKILDEDPETEFMFRALAFTCEGISDMDEIAAKAEEKAKELFERHSELLPLISDISSLNLSSKEILNWEPIPIKIKFNSPGGWLLAYQTLADVIKLSKTKVIGINMGMAYSAAAFLLISCHERLALPKSRIMVHRGSGGNWGSFEQTESSQQNYKEQVDEMISDFKKRTKIPMSVIRKKMNPDWYLSAENALHHGMIDRIVTDINEII